MKTKRSDLFRLFVSLGILVALSYLLSFFFFKIDLTEEKRHTLTDGSKEMLKNIDNKVLVRCYLHGDFPAGFKRLEQNIKERLDEFRDYSGGLIDYEFIDPYESGDKKTIADIEKALFEKGLKFTRLNYTENGASNSKLIWPGAIIEFGAKEYAVQFFKSDMPEPSDEMINSSVNNLEFELTSTFRKILRNEKPAIAVLEGHRELSELQLADMLTALDQNYAVEIVTVGDRVNALSDKLPGFKKRKNKYEALIIAKPDSVFSDKERVIIDQFVMNGGKVLWMIDPVRTDLDSLRASQETMAVTNELGLYSMLFEYGARLNRDIVLDFQGAPIAFDAGPMGNQRNLQMFTWYYSPLLFPGENPHPIVANLDPIKTEFASSIDTVNTSSSIRKTPLLRSSKLSKQLKAPVRIHTAIVEMGIDYFKTGAQPDQIMALLMEGEFPSAFKDQLPSALRNDTSFAFQEKSKPTKMILIGDGDVARNAVKPGENGPIPIALGYDRYAQRIVYDNKEFLLNCMNYLMDDQALISVRSRTIKLRKLDQEIIAANKTRIQIENSALPLVLVMLIGVGQYIYRKRKYARVA